MNHLTLFEGKTLFNKLWPLFDLKAKLDLRLTNISIGHQNNSLFERSVKLLLGNLLDGDNTTLT